MDPSPEAVAIEAVATGPRPPRKSGAPKLMDPEDDARRVYRRRTAEWSFRFILASCALCLGVGLYSDSGASRVALLAPALVMLLGVPGGIVLGYLGASAWEAKSPSRRRSGYGSEDYDDGYGGN